MTIRISPRQARLAFMHLQGLGSQPRRRMPPNRLLGLVEQLGFVQVDSINTLERAHHHILFSRAQGYRPAALTRLLEKDRALFENWTHDASVIPTSFFPYWRHRFEHEKERLPQRWKDRLGDNMSSTLDETLRHLEREGPVLARDFEGRERPSTGWWDWHPMKTALEYLWRTGEVAVAGRSGFQKIYDLTERVIPEAYRTPRVAHDVFVDWACRSALARLGVATRGEIAAFWDLLSPAEVGAWLSASPSGVLNVQIEADRSHPSRTGYALEESLPLLAEPPPVPAGLRLLNPFDPLIRDRNRALRLFGFDYRIEVFVPAPKRRYGYYVLPVLRGDRLVGRLDAKADRQAGALHLRAFWPERGLRISDGLIAALENELERFAMFAGVERVTREPDWLGPLQR